MSTDIAKTRGDSATVQAWAVDAGYSTPGNWAGIFVHHVFTAARVDHGGLLDPPDAGKPAVVFARALAGGMLSDLPRPGCIILQGEVAEVSGVLTMTRPENILIFVSGDRANAVLLGGNLGSPPGEVAQIIQPIPARNYFACIPPGLMRG